MTSVPHRTECVTGKLFTITTVVEREKVLVSSSEEEKYIYVRLMIQVV